MVRYPSHPKEGEVADSAMENTRVFRGGYTTKKRVPVVEPEAIVRSPSVVGDKEEIELCVDLPVSSGYSRVHVLIGKKDFALLLKAMARAHREIALHAMATELSKCLEPPSPRRRIRSEALL